jgi:hypothetical protein
MSGTTPASSNEVAGPTGATAPATGATGATGPSGTSTSTAASTADSWTDSVSKFVEDVTGKPMTSESYGIFILVFLFVLSLTVLVATGSILSVLVTWALIGLVVAVLVYYDMIDIGKKKKEEEKAPAAPAAPILAGRVGQEVFHISQNQFTYDDAPAVCAAYGAEMATLEQIIDAYNSGAEWCGYGWSAGGMALYPTQKKTWTELQREIDPGKRTACGRPGVNGGYMDPTLKFGVNCFGFKPQGDFTPPAPVPGTDRQKFDDAVSKFKEMLNTLQLSPFSRNEWSGYDSTLAGRAAAAVTPTKAKESFTTQTSGYGSQFKQDLGRLVEEFETADPEFIEAANTVAGYDPKAPYGLRGDTGPRGPRGAASTVPGPPGSVGPEGRAGSMGPTGPQGPEGAAAAKGDTGPAGQMGPTGSRGENGSPYSGPPPAPGRDGATGPKGDKGDPGPVTPAPLRITNATYGVPGALYNVTDKVQKSFDMGGGVLAGNLTFGDPAPGNTSKATVVKFIPPGGQDEKSRVYSQNTTIYPSMFVT